MLLKKSLMRPASPPIEIFEGLFSSWSSYPLGRTGHFSEGVQRWLHVGRQGRSGNACSRRVQPRPPYMVGEGFQVLHDGCEVELVACTGKAPQPHTLETVVRLYVRKAHLDLLALVTGSGELRRSHQGARRIACVLMHVARDFSEGRIRSARGLERT